MSPFAEAGYLNTRQRASEEIDARSRRVERRGQVGVGIALTPKISGQVSAAFARTAFVDDAVFDDTLLAEALNRRERTLAASVRYAATPLTTVFATSDMAWTRFIYSPIRDADSRQTLFGVELAQRALISGSAGVGYQRFRPRDASLPSFDGLVGFANVAYRLRGTTIGFSFNRGLAYSYFESEPYYVREGYGLSIRRRLVERWDVGMSGGRFWYRYRQTRPDTDAATATAIGRSDTLLNAEVEVGYQVRPVTRFTVRLSYQDRQSDYAYRTYDGLRLGTSVVYGF